MKALWEFKHDWWLEDFRFEIQQMWELKKMLRRHPDDNMSESFRSMIKMCQKRLDFLKVEYKKIYGDVPNLRKMREEIERE